LLPTRGGPSFLAVLLWGRTTPAIAPSLMEAPLDRDGGLQPGAILWPRSGRPSPEFEEPPRTSRHLRCSPTGRRDCRRTRAAAGGAHAPAEAESAREGPSRQERACVGQAPRHGEDEGCRARLFGHRAFLVAVYCRTEKLTVGFASGSGVCFDWFGPAARQQGLRGPPKNNPALKTAKNPLPRVV